MSEQRKKKSYAAFLIDRPSNASQLHQGNQGAIITLMNCLRHRLVLTAGSKKSEHHNIESGADGGGSMGFLLAKYQNSSSAAAKKTSVYDTLLQLIDEFDATGAAEIFRLLLERRTAIPLFVPDSRKHHLNLFRHITVPGVNTRLGEDQSLFRVAVISCCQRNVSQTTEIMNNVFNVQSVHRQDLSTGSLSSNPLIAEIGVGCLVIEATSKTAKKVQHVLVIHVIGEFRPLWKCLQHFVSYLLVEDSTIEEERFCHMFPKDEETTSTKHPATALGLDAFNFSCVWTPSMGEMSHEFAVTGNGFRVRVEGQLRGETLSLFKDTVSAASEMVIQSNCTTSQELKMLHAIPVLIEEAYSPLECVSPSAVHWSDCRLVQHLGGVKKFEFLLQKYYLKRAKIEEAKVEHRLNNEMVAQFEDGIRKVKETIRSQTVLLQDHPLLKLFLNILEKEDSCSRVLSFGLLEKELAKRGEQELGPLLKKIQELSTLYAESLSNAVRETGLVSKLKKDLNSAKTELIDSALNVEHLWRELSHLYTDMDPEKRSPLIQKIPRLAAQHLLDGFPLELLDGDSNMIRQDWIKVVLYELGKLVERKRMFVLSVMGVQSSGKSTMLNTMFGIRMRTSVGQCTRGVNMQLLAVEGRPEYDYILLLDTEGTRAPEYHGLPGSEKRDNQMATLSILLSDATIIIIPGENDAAVKEILPIVLMAYDGTKLAERNGSRLSSRMFFLYNRIDTSQASKLDNIIQTLGTSLHTAFNQVQKLTGNLTNLKSESPFGSFNLHSSSSNSDRDVIILGNVKSNYEPPGDVPDEAYGEALIKFREHIHQRVVSNVEGEAWESRTLEGFSSYIKEVWYCICSADFNFNFATVIERMTFDQLDIEYKMKEQELSLAYMECFTNIKKKMRKMNERKSHVASAACLNPMTIVDTSNNNNEDYSSFITQLNYIISPTLRKLDDEVKVIVGGNGREKWGAQFLQMWKLNKKEQQEIWKNNVKNAFNRIFLYEQSLESYKRKMRQEINEFFELPKSEWENGSKLDEKFEDIFGKKLREIKEEFPPSNVKTEVGKVYREHFVIHNRKIKNCACAGTADDYRSLHWGIRKSEDWTRWVPSIFKTGRNDIPNTRQEAISSCVESIGAIVFRAVTGKMCYDNSIVSNVVYEVNAVITQNNVTDNTEVEKMHNYALLLIVELMQVIQKEWEAKNSVYAKFESSKGSMRNYFDLVSKGAAKTKIFSSTMANTLSDVAFSAFEEEMVAKTYRKICNERWIHEARIMHKHMDLYLIDLLEANQIDQVLDYIDDPKTFYTCVLRRLIALKVPNVANDVSNEGEWTRFTRQVKDSVKKAALATLDGTNKELAQTFVDKLRDEFSDGVLQSDALSSAFSIDCSGEYEECDNEDKKKFQEDCEKELNEAIDNVNSLNDHEGFAEELSPQVVEYMKSVNNQIALPRCDARCPMCHSLCIETFNHDTEHRPHDAIHQPGGVVGISYRGRDELVFKTCSQFYEEDSSFYFSKDDTARKKYRDFTKVYPSWKDPRINEESPLREYILATFNNKIAEKYSLKPCPDVPESYFRVLSTIKEQLKMEID